MDHCTSDHILCILALQEAILLYIGLTMFITEHAQVNCRSVFFCLEAASLELKQNIKKDIKELRECTFTKKQGHWSAAGNFRRVEGTNLFVYEHTGHVSCSNISLDSLSFKHTAREDPVIECTDIDHNHHIYLPFFNDNIALLKKYEILLQREDEPHTNFLSERLSELKKFLKEEEVGYLSKAPFFTGGKPDMKGAEMNENVWTRRLVGCVQHNKGAKAATYTAETSFFSFISDIFDNFANKYQDFFPIRGTVGDAIVFFDIPVVTENLDIVLENGKKAAELNAYPNKLGELYGGMHLHLSRMVIRKLIKKFVTGSSVKCRGLYINKGLAAINCSVEMPIITGSGSSHVDFIIEDYSASTPDGAILCHSLGQSRM